MNYVSKIDRSERRKKTAEDFTPPELVNMMLDKLPQDMFTTKKTFLDPAAGNGNIIIEIIRRKIEGGLSYTDALESTFAIEIMPDNVVEMKERVFQYVYERFPKANKENIEKILDYNFVCHDALDWDYDNWRPYPHPTQLELFS